MTDTHYQLDQQFWALAEGKLSDGEAIQRAFISLVHAIWNGAYQPQYAPEALDTICLRRVGYLLETIKLFTHSRDICSELEAQIDRARRYLYPAEIDVGFLPARVERFLIEPDDELAAYWGLRSGIKVHHVPGFLAAFFSGMKNPGEPVLAPRQLH